MHSSSLARGRNPVALRLVAGALLAVGLVLATAACSGPRYERRGVLHCVIEGRRLYTFDPVWRIETLREIDADSGRVDDAASSSPETAPAAETARVRLRTRLLRELGVTSLDAIPREGVAERDAIRALGYF